MKIKYVDYKPSQEVVGIIATANRILSDYQDQGFNLTLRQLYYQFIARDLFPASYLKAGTKNNVSSYNKLGAIVSKARDAGMLAWDTLTDRGRQTESRPHWDGAQDFLRSVAKQCNIDRWKQQKCRVLVWVEKDALSEIVAQACRPLDVPYLACKGYVSSSTMWDEAYNRIRVHWQRDRQHTVLLHLGDHDPSGIDMTRDIRDRLLLYSHNASLEVDRIALTMDQIEQYAPPPNFAKDTDSRFESYEAEYGNESWELDALEPRVLIDLIQTEIRRNMDDDIEEAAKEEERRGRDLLLDMADRFERIRRDLANLQGSRTYAGRNSHESNEEEE